MRIRPGEIDMEATFEVIPAGSKGGITFELGTTGDLHSIANQGISMSAGRSSGIN